MSIEADPRGGGARVPETRDQGLHADSTLPPSERGVDAPRDAVERDLASGESRPLSDEERDAAETDDGLRPRVYAPASERVPREPIPGHDVLVAHIDEDTPERRGLVQDRLEG